MRYHDDNYEKILLLQLRKHRPVFYLSLKGPLGQKRRRGTKELVDEIQAKVQSSLTDFRWSSVPRAKMAVAMTFMSSRRQPPAIQNLTKFYMDELRKHVFTDDRQVACLTVQFMHNPKEAGDDLSESVFIKVERLADYKWRFDAYFALRRKLGLERDDWLFDDPDNDIDFDELSSNLNLPPEHFAALRQFEERRKQKRLLGFNRIEAEDRPGLRRKGIIGYTPSGVIDVPRPFVIELGRLPGSGETKTYKNQIRESFRQFKGKYKRLGLLSTPVVLDVSVSSKGNHAAKDLDNIMRDIAPIFFEEMLISGGCLEGFRIYVVDSYRSDLISDSIRVKLLPYEAIWDFEHDIDRVLEEAEEAIDK